MVSKAVTTWCLEFLDGTQPRIRRKKEGIIGEMLEDSRRVFAFGFE
jgi:hypothetical protein